MKRTPTIPRIAALACAALIAWAPGPARAELGGLASLKIVAELQLLYARFVDSLDELRRQTAVAGEVRGIIERAGASRDAAQNGVMDALLRNRRGAFDGRWSRDFGSRATAMLAALLKRASQGEPVERERWRRDAAALERIVARHDVLDQLAQANARNLERSNVDLSARESGRISAQALSVIADSAIRRAREDAERQRLEMEDRQVESAVLGTQRRVSRALRASGW